MQRILRKIIKVGTVTEPLGRSEQTIEVLGSELDRVIRKRFQKSLAIRQVDAGSCNACELEIHAMNNPYYDLERIGVHFVASPRHADLLLVTGPVSRNMEVALKMTYDAVPNPKMVIAAGDCAVCGGEFGCTYATVGAVSQVIPVDVLIHGCPPTPTDLIRGILMAVGLPE